MSRLTELLRQVKAKDFQLGADLEAEVKVLSSRRAFGLNFERHQPEAVELPERPIRKGDKVRVLPERGSTKRGDQRLWRVTKVEAVDSPRVAHLELRGAEEPETQVVATEDLVVVAEFRDPIYPGLASTGRLERGGDKPFHTVINAENFHALQTLLYTHRGAVDCIYIDPPYNTGAKDWKYNNDYVDEEDFYRHSKWLALIERRLKLAQELLNPDDSVLIVTIDEKEYLRLGLLLEQLFPEARIQMVTSVISAKGVVRSGQFSRVEEHIFFLTFGNARVTPWERNMLNPMKGDQQEEVAIEWLGLRRREPSSVRGARPNQFYPILVHEADGTLHSVGDALPDNVDRASVSVPLGTVALWPLKPDGREMLWGLTPEVLRRNWANGYARVNRWNKSTKTGAVQYLPGGTIKDIADGRIVITGRAPDGSVRGASLAEEGAPPPKRVWNLASHNAETGGTTVISALLPGRRFPYPKSLYAVEDALRFFLAGKTNATVLDFFAGSGTTAHAVMRLNKQDGGRRRSICISNNEVSAEEEARLRRKGFRPGDAEWEELGVCELITKPRIHAAVTGRTPKGELISDNYKYVDEFPMGEGFKENVEFFTLTYQAPMTVSHNRAFSAVAPLLWLRAGAVGRRIDAVPSEGWDVADAYGLLVDLDRAAKFVAAIAEHAMARMAFIVTNDDRRFQMVCAELPDRVEPVRLYESYLKNFEINTSREL